MRLAVDLDSDVAQLLRDAVQLQRQSFEGALNPASRAGSPTEQPLP